MIKWIKSLFSSKPKVRPKPRETFKVGDKTVKVGSRWLLKLPDGDINGFRIMEHTNGVVWISNELSGRSGLIKAGYFKLADLEFIRKAR